jgi:ubiquitin-protein ligase
MSALKRILNKDMKAIQTMDLNSQGIFIEFNEENMFEAKAMIMGPKDSLYFGGCLLFTIVFPKNYPFSPPQVTYISRNRVRIHPNLYVGGKVCLSILGTWSGPKWTTVMDITTILMSIQSLLDSNPLHHEPGQERNVSKTNDLYNEAIEHESISTLLFKNLLDTPSGYDCFQPMMKEKFIENHKEIHEKIKKKITQKPHRLFVPFYRVDINVDYNELSKIFNLLSNNYGLQ